MSQRLLINTEQVDVVRNASLFSDLSKNEQDDFIKGGGVFSYLRKSCLFNIGDTINSIYILCSGIVQELRQTHDGHEITTNIYKAGDVFCTTELFLKDSVHLTSAKAIDNVYVMELPIERFKENLQKYEAVRNRLTSALAQFAVMKQLEVERQITMSSLQLLASFLREMCDSHGFNPRGFTLPYQKSLIASRIGMEIETLSRALPRLKEHGIHVKGSYVSFTDLQNPAQNVIKLFQTPISLRRRENGRKPCNLSQSVAAC